MIPLLTIYDINRSNLTEQKNPFEYIVPPPSRGVGKIFITACSEYIKKCIKLHTKLQSLIKDNPVTAEPVPNCKTRYTEFWVLQIKPT